MFTIADELLQELKLLPPEWQAEAVRTKDYKLALHKICLLCKKVADSYCLVSNQGDPLGSERLALAREIKKYQELVNRVDLLHKAIKQYKEDLDKLPVTGGPFEDLEKERQRLDWLSRQLSAEYSIKNGGLFDLAPTVLDLLGLKAPKSMVGKTLIAKK